LVCLAFAGALADYAQIVPELFEVASLAGVPACPVAGDHLEQCLEELVVVVPGMFQDDRSCPLRAW
jgi:hypothetical protein